MGANVRVCECVWVRVCLFVCENVRQKERTHSRNKQTKNVCEYAVATVCERACISASVCERVERACTCVHARVYARTNAQVCVHLCVFVHTCFFILGVPFVIICLCLAVCVCFCTYAHTCKICGTCTCTFMCIYSCMQACAHVHTYVYTFVCMCTCRYLFSNISTTGRMHMCVHTTSMCM